jgi:CrcB protein
MLIDPNVRLPIAISLGAIAGALSRYYLNILISNHWGNSFPWGILLINITGCLLMGLIYGLVSTRVLQISPEIYMMLTTGFLGAYTTFSTYGLDTIKLLADQWWLGMAYAIGSSILGIANVRLGIIIAHWFGN